MKWKTILELLLTGLDMVVYTFNPSTKETKTGI